MKSDRAQDDPRPTKKRKLNSAADVRMRGDPAKYLRIRCLIHLQTETPEKKKNITLQA